MPIRIYDIAKELGVENHTVLAKAKELGIAGAKIISSSLDKITGEYLREKVKESLTVTAAPSLKAQPSITIRLTGAEFLEKARAGELQFFLEIAEAEGASPIRMRLSQDGASGVLPTKPKLEPQPRLEIDEETKHLFRRAYNVAWTNPKDYWVNLAEFGNALKKLRPTFEAQEFGERGLGSLLRRMTDIFEIRADESNPIVYYVRTRQDNTHAVSVVARADQAGVDNKVSSGGTAIQGVFPKVATGKVHNLKLGFGFIAPDDGSENLFFHATDVAGCTIFDLRPGDPVEYEPGVNEQGLCARKVRRMPD